MFGAGRALQGVRRYCQVRRAIGDKAAIAFSVGFYQALGAGKSFTEAYGMGCIQIGLQGMDDQQATPIMKIRHGSQ